MELHVFEWGDPAGPPLVCLHGVRVTASASNGSRRNAGRTAACSRPTCAATAARAGMHRGRTRPTSPISPRRPPRSDSTPPTGPGIRSAGGWFSSSQPSSRSSSAARSCSTRRSRSFPTSPRRTPRTACARRSTPAATPISPSASTRTRRRRASTSRRTSTSTASSCRTDGCAAAGQPAVVSIYGEIASPPPPPETLQSPTLLLYAPDYGLVRPQQIEAYRATLGDRLQVVEVPGMHMVMWDAFEETATAVEQFLAAD